MTALRTPLPERNLDTLRAFAVLCVLANHAIMVAPFGSAVILSYWLGRAGVLAFFVHTSLVLMSSLERHGNEGRDVTAFYIRRAFRIYPLAIVAILLVFAMHMPSKVPVHGVVTPYIRPRLPQLLANLALVQNLTASKNVLVVLWTLPIELQMYAVLPLCYLAAKRGPLAVASLLAIGVAIANVWLRTSSRPLASGHAFLRAVLSCGRARLRSVAATSLGASPELDLARAVADQPDRLLVLCHTERYRSVGVQAMDAVVLLPGSRSQYPVDARHESIGAFARRQDCGQVQLRHVPVSRPSPMDRVRYSRRRSRARSMAGIGEVLVIALPIVGYHVVEEPGIRVGVRVATTWVRFIEERITEPAQPVAP